MRTVAFRLLVALAALSLPCLMAGCPPQPDGNQVPTANAGPDVTVSPAASVTLSGSGTDPDGDVLTFSWTQTAGAQVTLSNANTATPSFTAPVAAQTLTFQLTVSDGAASASDSVNVTIPNVAPVANAGPNQTVNQGQAVTLNGSGSSDPNGTALTYSWIQTGGTTVTLNGATTAQPTFTAPNQTEALTFQLTVSDGTTSASDTVQVGVNTTVQQTPLLFVANINGSNVTAYDISSTSNVNGNVAPTANLAGAQTLLNQPTDIVLSVNGDLLVTNNGVNRITTYLNADELAGINGNIAPARNVEGAATTLDVPASLALRTTGDLLFVSDLAQDAILVFAGASASNFTGNLAPVRRFTSADLADPIGINFGTGDTLYVANAVGTPRVAVFDNASNLNGLNVAASRIITSPAFGSLFDVYVDAGNRMFVVDSGNRRIHVFNNASGLNGPSSPASTLTIPGVGLLTAIAVDTNGVGYVVDFTNNAVLSYDNIAARNGTFPPDRTLVGPNTQLSGPIRVFLSQP